MHVRCRVCRPVLPQAAGAKQQDSGDSAQGRRWIAQGIQADRFVMRGMVAEGAAPKRVPTRRGASASAGWTRRNLVPILRHRNPFSCHVEAIQPSPASSPRFHVID